MCFVLASRSVLVLNLPSDVIDLVPLHLAPTLSHESSPHHHCLSQAYSCSDHYTLLNDNPLELLELDHPLEHPLTEEPLLAVNIIRYIALVKDL